MKTQELVEKLVSGKKMTYVGNLIGNYCEYNSVYLLKGESPFRYINVVDNTNEPMRLVWNVTEWVEVKKPKWRLPTVKELLSVVDHNLDSPATSIKGFKPQSYWSSTINVKYYKFAWHVNFDYGKSELCNKQSTCYVRCVLVDSDEIIWSKSSKTKMDWKEAIEYAENLEE